jgi:hypothetical protein
MEQEIQEINTYIGQRWITEAWKFIKNTTTEKREIILILTISHKE